MTCIEIAKGSAIHERTPMNTPMTPPDSTATTSDNRSLGALLRDAQALVANATERALRDAGSSLREFRLLDRLARLGEIDHAERARHIRHSLDVKVAQPGSVAATFAARGWIAFTDQAWRLTPAGEAECARLDDIITASIPAAHGDALNEALTSLIDSLGGADAAREARRTKRDQMRERMASRMPGFGPWRGMRHGMHPGMRHGMRHAHAEHAHAEHPHASDVNREFCGSEQHGDHSRGRHGHPRGFGMHHGRGRGRHRNGGASEQS